MQSLSAWLRPAWQAAGYTLLHALVHIQFALRSLASLCSAAAARLAAAAPALRPALAALFTLPGKEHIGSRPQPPTTLGVAVAEDVADADWPAAVEALGRLLAWCASPPAPRMHAAAGLPLTLLPRCPADVHLLLCSPLCRAHSRGFCTVLVYEPAGCLQQPHRQRQLELQLLLQRLNGAVHLQAGWQAAPGAAAEDAGLTALLLAASDGEWPLLAAAEAADAAGGQREQQPAPAQGQRDAAASSAALDAAIAAPARLRARLQATGGPLAGAEPDFVLVCPCRLFACFAAGACRGMGAGCWLRAACMSPPITAFAALAPG